MPCVQSGCVLFLQRPRRGKSRRRTWIYAIFGATSSKYVVLVPWTLRTMSFSSDEVNFLVYRYLQESGMVFEVFPNLFSEKFTATFEFLLFIHDHFLHNAYIFVIGSVAISKVLINSWFIKAYRLNVTGVVNCLDAPHSLSVISDTVIISYISQDPPWN